MDSLTIGERNRQLVAFYLEARKVPGITRQALLACCATQFPKVNGEYLTIERVAQILADAKKNGLLA